MPPPSSSQQKVLAAQFVTLTGASERQATKYLKSAGYKINEAVDAYYTSNEAKGSTTATALEALFDKLRDDENDDKNKMELDSTMKYLDSTLHVNLENAELFVALEIVQAPNVGEITRRGFVDGWKAAAAGTTNQGHAAHIKSLAASLSTNPALFKKVYRYTFVAGREADQKSLSLENALVYWGMLFSPPGMAWKTKNHDWLDLWKTFLNEKWTRSVNKDMWNMALEFAVKSMADETLSFWNEDGAWPSVIDDFVAWCRGKGIGKSESMDMDEELWKG
ncbi:Scaffold-type E3 ligase [Conoideocrella luteorostrata]|uniref:Defective in cullin neddylation protein n=1 Tax=Conoideocrella luteorostrata TaxID=1105319 RepID=A0AAJ0G0C8_9HYPO|nr:Scaffold-type E3 ligase [Conoideocrella luteorostrata]